TQLLTAGLADELQLSVAPFFVGDSEAPRFVGNGRFPWNPAHRARLAEVASAGDMAGPRPRPPPPAPPHPPGTRPLSAGEAASAPPAPTGASLAASRAARPCRKAAAEAANLAGSRPCASSAPARPESTSPDPAVASHGVPVGLTNAGSSRSGVATTVVEPLSNTVAPSSAAAPPAESSPLA